MQIYIIRHATKVGEFMEKTAFFSLDNAKAKLQELAQSRLKELSEHIPNTELKDSGDKDLIIFIDGTRMETFEILTFETEDIGIIKEDILIDEAFPVTCLSREDLDSRGFDTSNVTDAQMRRLASKLGDDYVEQMYWTSLNIIADALDIPTKNLQQLLEDAINQEVDISDSNDAPSWSFWDDDEAEHNDDNCYTDRATAVRLRDDKVEVRWEGERSHPACWEPLENIEDEDNFEDFLIMLTDCVKEALDENA